jgi:ABC-type polar amino acid transport system ATPase subunit
MDFRKNKYIYVLYRKRNEPRARCAMRFLFYKTYDHDSVLENVLFDFYIKKDVEQASLYLLLGTLRKNYYAKEKN